jgi:hypothetical protein
MDYATMSPEAKAIFVTADLFGNGGKWYNAEFAAAILRSTANMLRNAYANEQDLGHPGDLLLDIANELSPPTTQEDR